MLKAPNFANYNGKHDNVFMDKTGRGPSLPVQFENSLLPGRSHPLYRTNNPPARETKFCVFLFIGRILKFGG
jgi:hypothetical protein